MNSKNRIRWSDSPCSFFQKNCSPHVKAELYNIIKANITSYNMQKLCITFCRKTNAHK